MGNAKSELGDHDGAIADYNRAIALKPGNESAYYFRGNARSELGDRRGAKEDYGRAIELNPEDADAYTAIADYSRAIEIKPDDADAYYNRGIAKRKLGDYDGAAADRKRAIELNPALRGR